MLSQSLTVSLKNTPLSNGAPSLSVYADVGLSFRQVQNFSIPGFWVIPAINLGDWGFASSVSGKLFIDPANSNYTGSLSASGYLILASEPVGGTVGFAFSNNTISLGVTLDVGILGSHFIGFTYTF